jgi:Zn-dependent alcohol dehydrogenase
MLDELVTQKYKLDDINEAMKDLRAGKNIRGRHRLRVSDATV